MTNQNNLALACDRCIELFNPTLPSFPGSPWERQSEALPLVNSEIPPEGNL